MPVAGLDEAEEVTGVFLSVGVSPCRPVGDGTKEACLDIEGRSGPYEALREDRGKTTRASGHHTTASGDDPALQDHRERSDMALARAGDLAAQRFSIASSSFSTAAIQSRFWVRQASSSTPRRQ
ncbi:hypothetical protein GCM10023169_23900 [Georgenia halophila]|uniref:Uncharacterized protein n=1 Tax=Georgenia halophila TaxID=620889 RepID=A0ABP8LCA9_9MICO